MMAGNLSDLLAQGLTLIACGVIVWRVEPALNRMSRCTSLLINTSFWLLLGSALFGAYGVLSGSVPAWPGVALAVGVALLLICERRIRFFLLTPRRRTAGEGR